MHRNVSPPAGRRFHFTGIGVSPGVAIGPAFVVEPHPHLRQGSELDPSQIDAEIERFRRALALAGEEVDRLRREVAERVDHQQAAIFDAHHAMLSDPMLVDRTIACIRSDRMNAEFVFSNIASGIEDQLRAIGDEYLAERHHDLADVTRRVLKFLKQLGPGELVWPAEGSIVIADDLGPADTAELHQARVAGFATNAGGPTGHTAIIARSLGIPAVVGVDLLTFYVRTGNTVIVDGVNGELVVNPTDQELEYYRRFQERLLQRREKLSELRDAPAVTRDGARIRLQANIEFPEEVTAALAEGAEGVGLYRTEFLYLAPGGPPSEERQIEAYREVLRRMPGPVTIRTLDLGGDKLPMFRLTEPEDNPFLGLRALRLCLRMPDLFRGQLRPLLRAACGQTLRLMLPMVSCVDEVRQARRIIAEVSRELPASERPVRLLVGAMIEIPSAALMADQLARECDFFSIGTNDLTQYVLAVDRISKSVAHLYQPTHPAVLRLIKMTVDGAHAAGIPVCVCGEMAGVPRQALLLVGLGLRDLSMPPKALPEVKAALRAVTLDALESLALEALRLHTAEEVQSLLARHASRHTGDFPLPIT